MSNSATPLIGSAAGSVLVAAAQWRPGNHAIIEAWLGLVYAAIGLRIWLTARCRRRLAARGFDRVSALRYGLTTGISGVEWGVGGMLVRDADPLALVVTITAVQAMVMGGVMTLGVFLPAFLTFAIPAILPMTVALCLNGDAHGMIMAIYSVIFLMLMISIAAYFRRSLRRIWQLTYEKEDLVGALTAAHDRLAILAETDGLTGLANRRSFDEVLETEFLRLRRSGAPLSLILVDVDGFKAFNDTYGHVAGDECLRQVAAVLLSFLHRAPDYAARYGGEEFAGLLPETDHQGAIAVAERIRTHVAGLNIPHRASAAGSHVTVSLGVVTVNCAAAGSPRDVVLLADVQLYRAKSEGRNRVVGVNLTGQPPAFAGLHG